MTRINTVLRELTFADLSDWAGDTMLNRGKSYVKQVTQLSRTDDDALVAWVDGSDRYTTSVQIDSEHVFDHSCTCPYPGGVCKHAVAVILAAAELIKNKRRIPLLDDTSDLGQALRPGITPGKTRGDSPITTIYNSSYRHWPGGDTPMR